MYTWIRFANPWIRFNLICQFSKDSICGFDLWCGFQKICFADLFRMRFSKDLICGFDSWCSFQKFRRILTNPANPHKSLVHRCTLDKWILNFWISKSVCSSKDLFCGLILRCGFQKIRFADSFRDAVFKRFDSRIHFASKKIQNYSICFASEGFVYKSRNLIKYPKTLFCIMIKLLVPKPTLKLYFFISIYFLLCPYSNKCVIG